MKLNKKKVFVSALAASLVAILSMGSIAWFSDSDEVTNTFKVATSGDGTTDDIFSVDVLEQIDVDGDGDFDQDDITLEKSGYTYEKILPGDQLGKKPWVKNTGSYDQYIRVKVTLSDADEWQAILGEDFALVEIVAGLDTTLWTENVTERVEDTKENTLTFVYYLNMILTPDASKALFTHVVIPEAMTRENAAALEGVFTMDIVPNRWRDG